MSMCAEEIIFILSWDQIFSQETKIIWISFKICLNLLLNNNLEKRRGMTPFVMFINYPV